MIRFIDDHEKRQFTISGLIYCVTIDGLLWNETHQYWVSPSVENGKPIINDIGVLPFRLDELVWIMFKGTPPVDKILLHKDKNPLNCNLNNLIYSLTDEYVVGDRYGSLTVYDTYTRHMANGDEVYCKCKCDCGGFYDASLSRLKSGKTIRCLKCAKSNINYESGSKHPLYKVWSSAKSRYGRRMCPEWYNNADSFIAWAKSRGWIKGNHIRCIQPSGVYNPDTCYIVASSRTARLNPYIHNGLSIFK